MNNKQPEKTFVLQKKDLNHLLDSSRATNRDYCSLFKEIINKTLSLIQQVFSDPDSVCVRFVFDDLEFKTINFKVTHYNLSQVISIKSKNDAKIEVFGLQPDANKTENNKKFYSKKEAALVKSIAQITEDVIKQTLFGEEWERDAVKNLEKIQNSFMHQLHFEETINEFTKKLSMLSPENIDDGIVDMLHILLNFLCVDGGCVFIFSEDRLSAHREYQANTPGSDLFKKTLLASEMPELFKQVMSGKSFYVCSLNDLSKKFALEKRYWRRQGVQSFLVTAIMIGGKSIGFLGFKAAKKVRNWSENDLTALSTLGRMLGYVLVEKELYLERKIHVSKIETMVMEMLEALSLAIEKRDL